MSATEVEIDTYLNLLISTTSIDIDCPICHEPYPEYDQGTGTDYAVWPTERQETRDAAISLVAYVSNNTSEAVEIIVRAARFAANYR
jgi:hypothetical protein